MDTFFMNIEKKHTRAELKLIEDHNLRVRFAENVDPEKTKENILLVYPDMKISEFLDKRLAENGFRTNDNPEGEKTYRQTGHNAAVLAFDILVAVSLSVVMSNPFFSIGAFCSLVLKWIEETFGKENIAEAVFHADEHSPHIHAVVIPFTKDGRLSAKDFAGGPHKLVKLQDSIAEYLAPLGLERGMTHSGAFHADTRKEFYAAVDKVRQEQLPIPATGENIDDYYARANKAFIEAKYQSIDDQLKYDSDLDHERTLRRQAEHKLLDEVQKLTETVKSLEERLREAQKAIETYNVINIGGRKSTKEKRKVFQNIMDEFYNNWLEINRDHSDDDKSIEIDGYDNNT